MIKTPIYFNDGLNSHGNFVYFFEKLKYFKDKKIEILHLGAYTGHGTKWILERVNGSCIDVDPWRWPIYETDSFDFKDFNIFYDAKSIENMYDETTKGLATTKFKGTTKDFFSQNKKSFDFIYIDASHKKLDVEFDLEESWKILNNEGVIACDDYLWYINENPELIPYYAIKDFYEKHKLEIEVLIDNYQFWFKKTNNYNTKSGL